MRLSKLSDRVWQGDHDAAVAACGPTGNRADGAICGVICPAFNERVDYHQKLAILTLPIWDDSKPPNWMFDLALRFHEAVGPVLVHCTGGENRSSAFAAAMLVGGGASLAEAWGRVHKMPWRGLEMAVQDWAERRRMLNERGVGA